MIDQESETIALVCGLAFEKKIAETVIEEEDAGCVFAFNAGMGGTLAQKVVDEAIKIGANGLVSYGVCGALSPQLVAGDVIVPERIISAQSVWQVDKDWRGRLVKVLSAQYEPRAETLLTVSKTVSSVAEKAKLFEQTGAGAVDMESAVIAQLAQKAGLPFIAVRVVHDTAGQAIPPAFADIINEAGQVSIWKLIKGLIFNWPGMAVIKALSESDAQARTNLDGLTRLALPFLAFRD